MRSPVIQFLVQRLVSAWQTPASLEAWLYAAVLLGIYSVITVPITFGLGFVRVNASQLSVKSKSG
ncbi:hypothetical protein [Leptodesmis sp.]|uniref:hypothetical protein n=1 Tax=Leptodesmis sp. TaxID=3100501 RepID=UPI00405357D6